MSVPVSAGAQSGGDHSRPRGHARVIFIDLARALAAVFMLYGHTVSALLHPRYQTGTWFDIWLFQRGLTSSLFLLLSGFAFSIATGRHWSVHGQLSLAVLKRIRRFSLFILLGYALHFPVARFADLALAMPERWRSFLAVDVLQLIGATFIGVQILVMLTRSRRVFGWTSLAVAVAVILATPWFWRVDWTSRLPLSIAAYLSPSAGSQFPLFPWSAYVLLGAALGQWYLRWGSARLDWYANVALFAPGLALVTLAFLVDWFLGAQAWESVPNQVALRMGASLVLLALVARGSQHITRLPHIFGAVAQETLLIYFVHLCIVYGSVWNRGLAQVYGPTLGPGQTVVFVVTLLTAMFGLALYWNWWKHTRPRMARWTALVVGGLLLYRLL